MNKIMKTGAAALAALMQEQSKMADKRVGALIVLLGPHGGLKGVTETGTPIHAKVTEELLLAAFHNLEDDHESSRGNRLPEVPDDSQSG